MRPLPKTLARFASKIDDWEDARGDRNGWWIYYRPGWKSSSDPVGNQHQEHEDTLAELAQCCREALPCDCADCQAS